MGPITTFISVLPLVKVVMFLREDNGKTSIDKGRTGVRDEMGPLDKK